MAKFYGTVGYQKTVEIAPGVFKETFVERPYYGDLVNDSYRVTSSQGRNDDLALSNKFSIVADPYAMTNYSDIRWVKYQGVKWRITNILPSYPRIELSAGSVYTEETTEG